MFSKSKILYLYILKQIFQMAHRKTVPRVIFIFAHYAAIELGLDSYFLSPQITIKSTESSQTKTE